MCAEAPASLIRNDAPSHPAGWVVFLLSWVVGIAADMAMEWTRADWGFIAGVVAVALFVIDAAWAAYRQAWRFPLSLPEILGVTPHRYVGLRDHLRRAHNRIAELEGGQRVPEWPHARDHATATTHEPGGAPPGPEAISGPGQPRPE